MKLNPDGRTCSDMNECESAIENACNNSETCINLVANSSSSMEKGYYCKCKEGFYYDPEQGQCADVDECVTECQFGAECTNTIGSYECRCRPGYEGDGNACSDINECLTHNCGGVGTCLNYPGWHYCECYPGYAFADGTCVDINECQLNEVLEKCPPPGKICSNVIGTFKCVCNYSSVDFLNSDNNTLECEGEI